MYFILSDLTINFVLFFNLFSFNPISIVLFLFVQLLLFLINHNLQNNLGRVIFLLGSMGQYFWSNHLISIDFDLHLKKLGDFKAQPIYDDNYTNCSNSFL